MNPFRLSSRVLAPSGSAPPSDGRAAFGVPAAVAVAVPWRVVRRSDARGVLEIEHCGAEPLRAVRFVLAGDGMLGLSLPRTVHPGERLRVVLRGPGGAAARRPRALRPADRSPGRPGARAADRPAARPGPRFAPGAMLVLRWFQPDGRELLWPIAL